MAKKKASKKFSKSAKPKRTEQEEEFSPDMLQPHNVRERISISFRQDLLDEIRKQAAARDIGYQVLIQSVLSGIFLDRETEQLGERLNARINIQKMQDNLELLKQYLGQKK